jgi:hypothetical protein
MKADFKQVGRIGFSGRDATKFWVRALGLEENVKFAQERMIEKAERKWAAVPIVAEYEVDPQLSFIYLIVASVDALGICDGSGVVYFCSPDRLAEVKSRRDQLANEILSDMKIGFDEIVVMDDKTEKTRPDP